MHDLVAAVAECTARIVLQTFGSTAQNISEGSSLFWNIAA